MSFENIFVDFMTIKCDCGTVNSYNEDKCKKCGKLLHVDDKKDEYVILRKAKFEPILSLIATRDMNIKNMRKSIREHKQEKTYISDFIGLLGSYCNSIQNGLDKNVFSNMNFKKENLDNPELNIKLLDIKLLLTDVYDILDNLIIVEFPDVWENAYYRFLNTINKYILALKTFIFAIVAETLDELYEKQKIAQEYIDSASRNIFVFSNILKVKQIDLDFNMFIDGKLNKSSVMAMIIAGSNFQDLNKSYSNFQREVYDYFSDYLIDSFDEYKEKSNLILLAPSKLMALLSFRETKFLEKTKIAVDLLERAYNEDDKLHSKFLFEANDKLAYALTVITSISEDMVFTFGYNASAKLMIKKAIGWYKELTEGVFRDISNIFVFSAKMLDHKTLTKDEFNTIIEDESFSEKLEYLSQKTKFKLDKLTEGIEKAIRHAEAHVDYTIDTDNETILLRNKNKQTKKSTELKFTFLEFINLENICLESVFSMITGIYIFMLNHNSIYAKSISKIMESFENNPDDDIVDFVLPLMGIIVEHKERIANSSSSATLLIDGVSIEGHGYDYLKKCQSCVAPLATYDNNIEFVQLKLTDTNNIYLGTIKINLNYVKEFFKVSENLRKYDSLLTLLTTRISCPDNSNEETESTYGSTFILTIINLTQPLFKQLLDIKTKLLNGEKSAVCEIAPIYSEFSYVLKICDEYSKYIFDDKLLKLYKSILLRTLISLRTVMDVKDYNLGNKVKASFNAISSELICIPEITKIISSGVTDNKIAHLVQCHTLSVNALPIKIGPNEPCPCGSGKKYKKCCKDKIT